ncbi:MAG: HAMP domain-containing sensor histidine kinase [Myxococcota bacterium]
MAVGFDSAQVRELLRNREARGLRIPLFARVVLLAVGFVSILAWDLSGGSETTSKTLHYSVMGVLVSGVAFNLYLYQRLWRCRDVEWIGTTGAAFDGGLTFAFLGLILWALSEDGLSPACVFKSELPVTYCTLVIINGLALRPRYPLIVGIGAVLSLVAALVLAILSPATRFSSERFVVLTGQGHDATQIVFTVLMVAGIVAATTFAAHVARTTIREGIRRELEFARLQESQLRLVMQEKVGALGRLVAGVSHELNSPLGVLRSGLDTQSKLLIRMEDAAEDPPRMKKLLEVGKDGLTGLQTAAERISTLEGSLRALSHLDESGLQHVDLHSELETIVDAARRETSADTPIVLERGQVPPVEVEAAVMSQALLALVGWILRASNDEHPAVIRTDADEREVSIAIEGGSRSLSPEELASLFEVHFDGSGPRVRAEMALAASRAAAIRHGGDVTAEALEGEGVRFTVRLPLASA